MTNKEVVLLFVITKQPRFVVVAVVVTRLDIITANEQLQHI